MYACLRRGGFFNWEKIVGIWRGSTSADHATAAAGEVPILLGLQIQVVLVLNMLHVLSSITDACSFCSSALTAQPQILCGNHAAV